MVNQVQYFPHGPIHKLVGGVGGADYKTFMAANTANNVDLDLVSKWALLAEGTFKEMVRGAKSQVSIHPFNIVSSTIACRLSFVFVHCRLRRPPSLSVVYPSIISGGAAT